MLVYTIDDIISLGILAIVVVVAIGALLFSAIGRWYDRFSKRKSRKDEK